MGGVEKISSEHLARMACTYVRQSTPAQVRNNAESRERQYELSEREIVVTVDRDAGTIDATITWEGAAKTQLAPLKLRRQGQTYTRSTPEDTVALLRRLAAHYDDTAIALVLANQKRRTATGLSFTKHRVASLRHAHAIPAFTPDPTAPAANGEVVGIPHAAQELDVTPGTVYRWLRDGFIAGEQLTPGAPWRIRLDDTLRAKVAEDAPDGSLNDAARALGVVRQTVLHRVQRGELTAVHVRHGKRKGLRIQVKPEHAGLFDTPR